MVPSATACHPSHGFQARRRLLGALALLAAPWPARPQGWPGQPVRLIVPFTQGTGIDLIARTLAPRLSERLGQPFLVENRPGASGNIGAEAVARATDAHTLLVTVNTFVMNRSLYKRIAYDPVRDFAPITLTSWGALMLVVHPSQNAASAADWLAQVRAQPGRFSYASPGVGTPHHLAMALLEGVAGVDLLHVPYSGTAGALTDLLGGRIQAMFLPVHVATQHVRAGRLRALAVSGTQRQAQLPELPTLREAGLGAVEVDMWYGVLGPRSMPSGLVSRLNGEIHAILQSAEVRSGFETQGMVPAVSSPEDFARLIERDQARWAEVVQRARITAD